MSKFRDISHKLENSIDKALFKVKDQLNLFDPVIIYPYRGYGNQKEAHLFGRILEKEQVIHGDQGLEDTFWNNLRKVWKRFESDEIPGVDIEGEFQGIKVHTTSNEEGYFNLNFKELEGKKLADGWHDVNLRIKKMPFDLEYEEKKVGSILICNQKNDFGIISDIDDTIIKSEAMTTFKKVWLLLTKDAKTRVAFEGVEELYRELVAEDNNPLFFVSGSSYNLYDMLVSFCEHNSIPKAPFFLRDLGLEAQKWLKQDTSDYKKDHIDKILSTYDHLSFICIGDSGQKDPEIYAEVVEKYPGRIKAIYIRHVLSENRRKEMERISENMDVPFLIMENSKEALDHAKQNGWIKK